MRAMILAAGLGTRMGGLSQLRPKPALPLRGVPAIAHLLDLLVAHGVTEVIINLFHGADTMRRVAESSCPSGLRLHFSEEPRLLGTGGGIRRAAHFLRESATSLVLAGDMWLDVDLGAFAERHRSGGNAATLLLRRDSRARRFGSIGIDAEGGVRRIADSLDMGGETQSGLFVGVRAFAPAFFDALPERDDAFEDLRDVLAPRLRAGRRDVAGLLLDAAVCRWEPIGTPREYVDANLTPPAPLPASARKLRPQAADFDAQHAVVLGRDARLGRGVHLERAVVWEDEQVPAGFRGCDGVFAGGRWHRADGDAAHG